MRVRLCGKARHHVCQAAAPIESRSIAVMCCSTNKWLPSNSSPFLNSATCVQRERQYVAKNSTHIFFSIWGGFSEGVICWIDCALGSATGVYHVSKFNSSVRTTSSPDITRLSSSSISCTSENDFSGVGTCAQHGNIGSQAVRAEPALLEKRIPD